jgi:hypothetical protein
MTTSNDENERFGCSGGGPAALDEPLDCVFADDFRPMDCHSTAADRFPQKASID